MKKREAKASDMCSDSDSLISIYNYLFPYFRCIVVMSYYFVIENIVRS